MLQKLVNRSNQRKLPAVDVDVTKLDVSAVVDDVCEVPEINCVKICAGICAAGNGIEIGKHDLNWSVQWSHRNQLQFVVKSSWWDRYMIWWSSRVFDNYNIVV